MSEKQNLTEVKIDKDLNKNEQELKKYSRMPMT